MRCDKQLSGGKIKVFNSNRSIAKKVIECRHFIGSVKLQQKEYLVFSYRTGIKLKTIVYDNFQIFQSQ